MSGFTPTVEQERAITYKGGTLLVSAAAGSGKTKVLVERIISKILNDDVSVLDFLVVTFTKAAAAEMRERITNSLYKLLEKEPNNKRIQREIALIGDAKIDTIDGFYYKTVRENAEELGISPNIKIGSENDIRQISNRVIESLLDAYYAKADKNFLAAVNFFSKSRDDGEFVDAVKRVIKALEAYPNPQQFLNEQVNSYKSSSDIKDNVFVKEIVKIAVERLEYAKDIFSLAIELTDGDDALYEAYRPSLEIGQTFVELAAKELQTDYDNARENILAYKQTAFSRVKNCEDLALKKTVTDYRDIAKKQIEEVQKNLVFLSLSEIDKDRQDCAPHIEVLRDFVVSYYDNLLIEKKKAGLYAFSDLSRFMYKLLVESNSTDNDTNNLANSHVNKTQLAKDMSSLYHEIFVDEYQDTNALQDIIFMALSKDLSNLFMVGDIKQSIYRFRQAQPEIFAEKKDSFATYDNPSEQGTQIFLSKNFRSRKTIIDFSNFIFKRMFTKEGTELSYEGEELAFGANFDCEDDLPVEVNYITSEENKMTESEYVADKIEAILKNERVYNADGTSRAARKSDIAVLMRSVKKIGKELSDKLLEKGISSHCDSQSQFFFRDEISFLICLLRLIDNPFDDISTAAVMMSDIFDFTTDEMARIRINDSKNSMYESALLYLKIDGYEPEVLKLQEKLLKFSKKIARYQESARYMSVIELLLYISTDLDYENFISLAGSRQAVLTNLRLFYSFAGEFENQTFRGLYAFNNHIKAIIAESGDLKAANAASENGDVVRIMTIHHSKGLEFPFVIFCDTARAFNNQESKERLLIHKSLGIAPKVRDNNDLIEFDTVFRRATIERINREAIAEELRCLYVALTRPKEALYIYIDGRGRQSTVRSVNPVVMHNDNMHYMEAVTSKCFAQIILKCLQFAKNGETLSDLFENEHIGTENINVRVNILDKPIESENVTEKSVETCEVLSTDEQIKKEFHIVRDYEFEDFTKVVTKVSVSELKNQDKPKTSDSLPSLRQPKFLIEKQGFTGAQKGTILHRVVECSNFNLLAKSVETELLRLVETGFISEEEKNACDIEKLTKFTKSRLYERLINSQKIEKELVFNLYFDENNNESPILQGIIDLVFTENDKVYIVDYKSDRLKTSEGFIDRYSSQLEIYKHAYERMSKTKIECCYIYSFALGEEIEIK